MILVSFSSAGVAWFEDVKRYGTFKLHAAENPLFRFLWDTRYTKALAETQPGSVFPYKNVPDVDTCINSYQWYWNVSVMW